MRLRRILLLNLKSNISHCWRMRPNYWVTWGTKMSKKERKRICKFYWSSCCKICLVSDSWVTVTVMAGECRPVSLSQIGVLFCRLFSGWLDLARSNWWPIVHTETVPLLCLSVGINTISYNPASLPPQLQKYCEIQSAQRLNFYTRES